MKILILCDVLFPDTIGGAGRVAFNLCNELGKKGHSVHVVTRNPGIKLDSFESTPHFDIHRFNTPLNESALLFLHEIKNSRTLAGNLSKKIKFDILCVHQAMAAVGPLMNRRLKNIPLIYYFHSPWHQEYLIKKSGAGDIAGSKDRLIALMMRLIEKRMLNRASKVIVLSEYMKSEAADLIIPSMNKTVIIPGGVDTNNFNLLKGGKKAARTKTGIPSGKTVFLCVRNLVPRMGLDSLIRAFKESRELRNKGILYIGGTGPLENHLNSLVSRYRLDEAIHFKGHIQDGDLPLYYQAADFFILPTEKLEGFGLVILEAMACGTPVIGTPVGAIPEIIGAFDKRLLTGGTKEADIRKKMEEIIENKKSYSFAPAKCRKFVEKNYSWKKMADDFENTIKTHLNAHH